MQEFLAWFTHMENTKPLALVLNFAVFIGILAYLFIGKKRSQSFERHKYIPLDDEDTQK